MNDTPDPESPGAQIPQGALDGHDTGSTMAPGIVCGHCKRARTVADDYDYTPLQIFTGRPLGWFNGDGEQMCGQCLTLALKGQLP